ncbi:MAG: peptide deformylase [Candidatus Cloacimonadota bacterium]|nr:MAG: peptide deformylase [Candidatus Cloacimonadota bacterium]PIE79291.1 MAG: peptide deformylase [Candidatus Delongbacteria bacterium]
MEVMEYGEKVLRSETKKIEIFDQELKDLVSEMFQTCYDEIGVGLAAPQVGKSIKLFVISTPPEDDPDTDDRSKYFEEVFINPQIIEKKGSVVGEEGCLSVPGVYEKVKRAKFVRVKYFDIDGNEKEIEASGLLSRAIQHENDHLEGILFVDRLPGLKRELVKKRLDKEYGLV